MMKRGSLYVMRNFYIGYISAILKIHQSNAVVSLAQLGERQTEVSVTKSGGIAFDPRKGQHPVPGLARTLRTFFFASWWS
jgi:hypothetical protein